jgi:hemerythrin superfamily protein
MPAELSVQNMDGVSLILNDHRIVDELFTQYERTSEPERKLGLVAKMIEELSVHADVEERELYPVIRDRLDEGEDLFAHALEEHREAKKVLAELERLPVDDARFDEKVRELISEVRHHVEEEERTHLAQLRGALSEDELLQLGRRLREAKNDAPVRPVLDADAVAGDATKGELYERAKELGIGGRSSMTKEELAQAIAEQQ